MWKRTAVTGLAGITAFIFVFNIFFTLAPYPIAPFEAATYGEIQEFIPKGYAYPGDMPENVTAHTDSWKGYKVIEYYYCWGYDGYTEITDCEPVILLIHDGDIEYVAVRAHYNWRVLEDFPTEEGNVRVNFLYRWHTPQFNPPASSKELIDQDVTVKRIEDLNYYEIFGWTFSPVGNALTNAVVYASIATILAIGLTHYTVNRRFGG